MARLVLALQSVTGQMTVQQGNMLVMAGLTLSIVTRSLLRLSVSCLLFLTASQWACAADISRDVRAGREDESVENGGYLEISASAILNEMPIPRTDKYIGTFSVGGHYRYKRFFVDAYSESYNQFQLGINALSGPIWSLDILSAVSEHGVDSELNRELKAFTSRDPAFHLGVRATGYSGPYIFQVEAMADVSQAHGGDLVTASIARHWLVQNFNFHALAGARYESARALDYQFGVDADEATEIYPVYEAGAGTTLVAEAGITYPINQYFVFRSTGRWWELPSSVVGSPFITNDSYLTLSATITFVY